MDVTLVTVEGSKKLQSLKLRSEETIVGRRSGCDLRIPAEAVSRRHCRLSFRDDLLTIEDLASANGTFLNGQRITRPEVVRPGSRLEIGPVTFLVEYHLTPEGEARLAAMPVLVEAVSELEPTILEEEEECLEGVIVDEDEETVQAEEEEETGTDFDLNEPPPSKKKAKKGGREESVPDASQVMRDWELPAGADLRDILKDLGDDKG